MIKNEQRKRIVLSLDLTVFSKMSDCRPLLHNGSNPGNKLTFTFAILMAGVLVILILHVVAMILMVIMVMVVMLHLVRGRREAHRVRGSQVHRVAPDGPELH